MVYDTAYQLISVAVCDSVDSCLEIAYMNRHTLRVLPMCWEERISTKGQTYTECVVLHMKILEPQRHQDPDSNCALGFCKGGVGNSWH